ncbi:MAG: hypothetical protein ACF8R7_13295 [Phycisphaerales bacterium JB039]
MLILRCWNLLAAAALVAAACVPARGQAPDGFFQLPPGATLSWALDPGPLGGRADAAPGLSLSESLMRVAVAGGLLPEGETGEAVAAALVASALSSAAHRIILLEVGGDAGEGGDGLQITSLALVVEIWTGADHAPLRDTVRAALVDYDQRAGAGAQRRIDVGAGRAAMAYSRPDWPPWREVAWYSEEGRFIVAIGEGAMARWLEERQRQWLRDPWAAHRGLALDSLRESAGEEAARGPRVFELAADLDRFRRAFPEAISDGLAGQFLQAWGLSNARSFMLHGRLVGGAPAMLAVDATWSSRAEGPAVLHRKTVAMARWPDALGPAPEAPWACALAMAWPQAVSRSLATWGASLDEAERMQRVPAVQQWLRANGPQLGRLVALLDESAAVIPGPGGWPPGGSATVVAPALPTVQAGALEAQMRSLMRLLRGVSFDPQTRTWALGLLPESIDPQGQLGQIAWGVAERNGRAVVIAAAGRSARERVRADE